MNMIVDYSLDIERLFMSNVGCKPLAFPHKRVFAVLLNGLFPWCTFYSKGSSGDPASGEC